MILLDTHIIIWMIDENPRLGSSARKLIEEATVAFFSVITAWELAMLVSRSKLILNTTVETLLQAVQQLSPVREVAIDAVIALDAGAMMWKHGDPADRLIVATARALDCPLVTADEKILAYAAAGHLKAVDARL